MSEICFIEARPRIVATGAETVVRLAGGGSDTSFYRGGQHFRAGVVEMPRFRAAFGFDDNGWSGGTVPVSGALGFMPGQSELLVTLQQHYWRDAPIVIDAGDERSILARKLTGSIANAASDDGKLVFTLVDPSRKLDTPIAPVGFLGTGGIEGPVEVTGRTKRRSWGRVFNVEGELLDKANNIYEFGDPAQQLKAFEALRDKGRAGPMAALAWQGSVASTFAALQVAVAPEGGGVVAPAISCAKWWTVPAGPLTADLSGETAGGYTEAPVEIASRILTAAGGPAIANFAAANALRNGVCGIHIGSASDTTAQALDRLLLGISLYWVLQPDGTVRIGEWAWKAPTASLDAVFNGRSRQLQPVKSRSVGYRRNHRQHQKGEISVALDQVDWGTEITGRPAELTDGRVPTAIRPGGFIQGGFWGGAGSISIGEVLEAGLVGKSLAIDPDFSRGTSPLTVYNNNGGTAVMHALIAEASAPNGSGLILRVSYDGGSVSPGFGGVFLFLDGPGTGISRAGLYARGTRVAFVLRAKIPSGRFIEHASNLTGSGGGWEWLTSTAGTGGWESYIGIRTIGTMGIFSSTGFFFIHGGAVAAFSWDVALYDQRELGSAPLPQIGRMIDSTGTVRPENDIITSLGIAGGLAGAGAGAYADNLADLDPDAASLLTSLAGNAGVTVGYGEVIRKVMDAGADATFGASAGVNGGGTNGTLRARIEVSLSGMNSWSTVVQSATVNVGPGEPGQETISGAYTNSSGVRQAFDFRVVEVRTPAGAGGTINPPVTWLSG